MLQVDERYLTLPELAERLQVSRRTVYRWIKDGSLNAYQFGREYRITESDLKDFLERRRTSPHS
jgi:excisionase family DNA binding protein